MKRIIGIREWSHYSDRNFPSCSPLSFLFGQISEAKLGVFFDLIGKAKNLRLK
jgi:hypothetical protein